MTRAMLFATLLLTGCVPDLQAADPQPPGPGSDGGGCTSASLQELVGQPATVLETMRFGRGVRIIRPGMPVTTDYQPDRLNIEINAAEVIFRVSCG